MELPVFLQLRELSWALALGAALGLCHDLLRPLRRGPRSTALADVLWCLLLFLSLLGFALYAGRGRLRLFAPAAMALSGGLWLRLCSPPLRFLQRRLEQGLRKLTKKPQKAGKSFKKM